MTNRTAIQQSLIEMEQMRANMDKYIKATDNNDHTEIMKQAHMIVTRANAILKYSENSLVDPQNTINQIVALLLKRRDEGMSHNRVMNLVSKAYSENYIDQNQLAEIVISYRKLSNLPERGTKQAIAYMLSLSI